MKLGILGHLGVVGNAISFGFTKLDHEVIGYDIKDNKSKLEDILETELIFVCVPTPKKNDGSCDISIVESVINKISKLIKLENRFKNIIIKSTVTPGTTELLQKKYSDSLVISHSCEFLRERQACGDFVENQKLLVVGTHSEECFNLMKKAHGNYPKNVVIMTPTESELLKYAHNSINALRIVWANEFYDIAEKLNVNYTKIKNALLYSSSLPDIYLDVNKNMRGYSSICLNKDIPAICKLGKDLGLNLPLLYNIENSNRRHELTPFGNTRE